MPELGPAQIAALVLALALIAVGLSYGRGPWRPRKAGRGERAADEPPQEHRQFMRPGGDRDPEEGKDVG